jgi:hypothetical protein
MRRPSPRLPPEHPTPGRALVAGGIGNVVEWYDFAVYGAFATVIATTYFPTLLVRRTGNPTAPAAYAAALAVAAVAAAAASAEAAFRPLDAAHQPEPEPARPRR